MNLSELYKEKYFFSYFNRKNFIKKTERLWKIFCPSQPPLWIPFWYCVVPDIQRKKHAMASHGRKFSNCFNIDCCFYGTRLEEDGPSLCSFFSLSLLLFIKINWRSVRVRASTWIELYPISSDMGAPVAHINDVLAISQSLALVHIVLCNSLTVAFSPCLQFSSASILHVRH